MQLTFYNSGIGTYAKPSWKSWSYRKQVIANKLDLAFALRFEKIIISAYAWLVDNYEPGDRIFLFGFSRGAYQVRALTAMISVVGLLYKGNNDQIPFAYELYAASEDEDAGSQSRMEVLRRISVVIATRVKAVLKRENASSYEQLSDPGDPSMQDLFKATFSQPDVRVHFVGAWDTVSSVGFIRDKTLPKTTDGMKYTCFFRHVLALHEFRVKFLPEYANGSRGPCPEETPVGTEPHTKEVWFAGSHSDIGGGSTSNTTLDKFGPALRWMSHEATLAGLRIKDGQRQWDQGTVSKSMTFIWRIVECFPIKRLSYEHWDPEWSKYYIKNITSSTGGNDSAKLLTTSFPHLCARREIQPGQRIYWSVDRKLERFLPKFALSEHDGYATLLLRKKEDALELGCIIDERNSALFKQLTLTADGIESLREVKIMTYIYEMAQLCRKTQGTHQIMKDLHTLHFAYLKGSHEFEGDLKSLDATEFMQSASSWTFPFSMSGHAGLVSSVAFLSATRVVSGSWDRALRIWDISTGEMTLGSPLSDHRDWVRCVAVHAAKGLVASASDDSTIRLWTSNTNGAVHAGKVLQDKRDSPVLATTFSPDGSYLVSGSSDGAVCVWNAVTGERVGGPVCGHTDWVWSVAFSPDGKRIVSGFSDRTVQLWEWSPEEGTLEPCGEPLSGHKLIVSSVAFSPDASIIASGSWDKTVRIWNVPTGTSKFTLERHTGMVYCVAFSPSGMHVVSGSQDWTVRIWDARTGAAVRVFRGHTDWVWSIAFSPDGTRIASGSKDNTVRVWDFVPPPDESHPEGLVPASHTQIEPSVGRADVTCSSSRSRRFMHPVDQECNSVLIEKRERQGQLTRRVRTQKALMINTSGMFRESCIPVKGLADGTEGQADVENDVMRHAQGQRLQSTRGTSLETPKLVTCRGSSTRSVKGGSISSKINPEKSDIASRGSKKNIQSWRGMQTLERLIALLLNPCIICAAGAMIAKTRSPIQRIPSTSGMLPYIFSRQQGVQAIEK